MAVIATELTCKHCGSNLIIEDEDSKRYCLMCSRPYTNWQDYGALGGQATLARYGREWFREIGRRGGRPRLRQLPAPQGQDNGKGGALPNSLKGLKELYKQRRGELFAAHNSPQGG